MRKFLFTTSKWGAASLLGFIALVSFQAPTSAETYSKPGVNVTLNFFNGVFGKTLPGNISGTYRVKSTGTEGILFYQPRSYAESIDTSYFNFVDTKGSERCYGSTSMSSGGGSTWEIKGAVPGYKCSTVGKSYRFKFGR